MNTLTLTPLPALLEAEANAARALCAVLEREHLALTERSFDVSGLDRLLNDKSACVSLLQRVTGQRVRYLRERGFDAGDKMMAAVIARLDEPQRATAAALWRELSDLSQRARRQNETNGAVVNARRRFTEQALAALHGYSVTEQVYDQDARVRGRTAAVSSSRPLASA